MLPGNVFFLTYEEVKKEKIILTYFKNIRRLIMKEKYYKVSKSELMDLIECRERFRAVYMNGGEGVLSDGSGTAIV